VEGGFLPLLLPDCRKVFSFADKQEVEEKRESDKDFKPLGFGKI